MFLHVVRSGDTLYEISKRYHVPVEKISKDNGLVEGQQLVVGQSLLLVPKNTKHVVESGDTIESIAKRYHIPVQQILYFNEQIANPDRIQVGQEIQIVYSNYNKVAMEVNGYAYPNITPDALKMALPHLTYLSIFSYDIDEKGNLNDIDDERLIEEAYRYKVAPLLVVTNMDSPGNFSSEYASMLINDEQVKENLINSILAKIREKGYSGVNVDFEYLYPQDREAYNQFLRDLVSKLNPLGLLVTTALAPKTRADQPGILYEAHDYASQNDIVNRIILMTYEWGYIFGPEMPVAPLNKVEEVIEYAVTEIDPSKILMGIPNYGYDFKLPFVEGQMATIVTNEGAVRLAAEKNAAIEYDIEARSPYFVYFENNVEHNVHFEDARSITEKIMLAKDYELGGLSYWTLMEPFAQNWILIDYYIDVVKIL